MMHPFLKSITMFLLNKRNWELLNQQLKLLYQEIAIISHITQLLENGKALLGSK